MSSILYVAFHYPPVLGSSGVHRTLAFTRYLDARGWQVRVLTASIKAYHNWSQEQFSFIPEGVTVMRAFARDVSRHYSWRGKYFGLMALPDNWQSWIFGGVISGLVSIIRSRPGIIVSTYPLASAHVVAYILHRLTGIPWVADLRDPMAQVNYPPEPARHKAYEWIERKIVKHASYAVLTAPGAKALYEQRFPGVNEEFWQVLPNGFDEELFSQVSPSKDKSKSATGAKRKYVLLHSGVVYPSERDPKHFFTALAELKKQTDIDANNLEIRLRATGHDSLYRAQLEELGITDLVKLEPPIPYTQALEEMLCVDGLLLLQADNCNYQIPAKAYEYIRAQKPVLALTPAEGDTGKLLSQIGVARISPLDNKDEIKQALIEYLFDLRQSNFLTLDQKTIQGFSRQYQARKFEALLRRAIDV